jgi:ABC-type multidrug transport system ATPase subunit
VKIERPIPPGDLPLYVSAQGSDRMLQSGLSYRIGRDPESDIVVIDPRVSWVHAVLRSQPDGWLLEDSGSTNGIFVGPERVQQVPITGECMIRLGHPQDGPAVSCSLGIAPAPGHGTAIADFPDPPPAPSEPPPAQPQPPYGQPYQQPPYQQPPYQQPPPQQPPPQQPPYEQPPYEQPPYEQPPYEQPPYEQPPYEQQYQPPQQEQPSYGQPAYGAPAAAPPGYGAPSYDAPQPAPPQWSPQAQPEQPRARLPQGAGRVVSSVGSMVPNRPPSAVMSVRTTVLKIGRAADNDVVVADLSVSRYHAELRRSMRGSYEIIDLGSHNGTYLNGQRITASPVTEADIVGVGPATFQLVGDELQEFIDTGDVSLSARDLTVTLPSGRVLLDHVSFPLGERCLLGVIGPSGAGKSTLLGALTGMAPANSGGVLYDNRDLYTHYAELRHRIGLVPQDNILHTQLTADRALGFAAELRFPSDTSKAERERRIAEVLQELALTRHAKTRVSAMSGGQQKRVNVALELLTKPSLLYLDEPTSGLDPGLDKSVMEQMADLAHDGRTIIVVTHSVANLNLCDRLLVLVPGGKIAYFGPPEDGLRHFDKPGWAEVFQAFEAEPDRDWATDYRRSSYHQRYIAAEMDAPAPVAGPPQSAVQPPKSRNRLGQLSTLCRRYLAVIASDRAYLAVLGIMPVILGALAFLIPSPEGFAGHGNEAAISVLLVLVIGACFIGAANSVRELVKERAIYTRERAAGLSAGAYLVSKLLILAAISAVQSLILVGIGILGRKLPATGSFLHHLPLAELLIAMAVLSVVSMTLGLLISAVVNSSDKTMPLLVVGVMFQVILTGGIFPVAGKIGLEQISWIAPSRWGFAAVASTVNLNVIEQLPHIIPGGGTAAAPSGAGSGTPAAGSAAATGSSAAASPAAASPAAASPAAGADAATGTEPAEPTEPTDPLWDHTSSAWLKDMGLVIFLGLVFTTLSWWRLLKIKPGRRR